MSPVGGSIVRRLVAITLATGLVTGAIGTLLARGMERKDLRQQAAMRTLALAERTATLIDGRIDALQAQLELLASSRSIASLAPQADDDLAVALRATDEFHELVLYDGSGQAVAAAASQRLLHPAEVAAYKHRGRGVVRLVRDDEAASIEVAVAVDDPPGTRVGTLVGRAPVALLAQEAETRLLGASAHAFIADEGGTVLAHRELDRVLRGERFPVLQLFADGRRAVTVGRSGERVLAAGATFASMPGWVVVEQSEREVLRSLDPPFGGMTSVLLAVLVAMVGAVVMTGRRLLRPLGPLADAVERLRAGERGVRAETTGAGEIAVLAEGFNEMVAALEQRQQELEDAGRKARTSEERLRLMVEGVRDYAIILLDVPGRVQSWNAGARRLLGYSAEDAVGRALVSFCDPDAPPADPLPDAVRVGRGEAEGWYRREDGTRFWAHVVVTALQDDSGEGYGYAAVLHDLTERHAVREAMEAALHREREAADELRRTNETKDTFIAIAAHEIRTPLSAVVGASHVLSRDWDTLSEQEKVRFRDMIEVHSEDMRLIVERLLDFSRLQAGTVRLVPQSTELRKELSHHLILLGRHLAEHRVVIDAPPCRVRLDREALRHIVTNLLSNAAKFSPPRSTITLRARCDGETVVISVVDEGVGVPADEQQSIFEIFRQASNQTTTARGTGVGLAIVKRYLDLLGGTVELSSAPGQGSTFTVTIPTQREPEPA